MHEPTSFAAAFLALAAISGCGGGKELSAFDRTWEIKSGEWHLEGAALVGRGGVIMSAEEQADMVLEVDVEAAGMGDRTFGIGFRQQPREPGPEGEKKGAGYGFNFTGNRTFNVFKGKDNTWSPVNPAWTSFQPSPALDPVKNHVVVKVAGRRGDIDVNGKRVASFEDDLFLKGRVSFWVESTALPVKITNVRIGKGANR
jgi:hypothetical protein